ncbi:hypothetical protein BDY17DRAFT_133284 [Neohortaea acidophila]|uniref:Uncharacterized protein n=1 Tax=Neohortaea acidophila TaxID=245834 RepID=A0A6A6PY75_9PEZI|nr:uncharacterized protein BDY17DRAFT_133284 [Neohortaea acidophila]KAF2484679.1 hypothetical protein BDY17DRAFT_133284 [Neohortaea acidophila]
MASFARLPSAASLFSGSPVMASFAQLGQRSSHEKAYGGQLLVDRIGEAEEDWWELASGCGARMWNERARARACSFTPFGSGGNGKEGKCFHHQLRSRFFFPLLHRAAARVDVCALNLGCGMAGVGSSIGWWRRLGGGVGSHVGRKRRRGGWWSLLCGCVSMCLGRA